MIYFFILLVVLICSLFVCFFLHKHFLRLKQIEQQRVESDLFFKNLVAEMKVLVTIITHNPEHYLSATERNEIKIRIDKVLLNVETFNINKSYYGYEEYYVLKMAQVDVLTRLNKLNEVFINEELEKNEIFFNNIDGKKLDLQQRKAIVIDENHNLIIAGAGSGKTLTILGKVLYLLKNGISPSEILLIAFTKKSAGELKERISRSLSLEIKAVTFHSLGLSIIAENNKKRPDVDDNIKTYVEDYFSKELINHLDDIQNFLCFIGYYFNIPIILNKDGTLGEAIEGENHVDFETLSSKYKKISKKEKKTIKGERVKSVEELIIANFLFLNGVKYEYEKAYKYPTDSYRKTYRPDFYLPEYDLYLEHFGIDKNNRCPWLSKMEEKKYLESIEWKRNIHCKNNTNLIETYSYFQSKGELLIKIKELLTKNKINLSFISNNDMIGLLKELCLEETNAEFIKLCITFIQLFKANGYGDKYFETLKKQLSKTNPDNYINTFLTTRTLQFVKIIEKIFVYYQKQLAENNTIDFADMINIATNFVKENGVNTQYKHIIIDEYQDIGRDRYNLIKAIIEKTSAHLMCVGDDWQSIYRFAGSDANLITNFQKLWGNSQLSKIEKTYRNSQELINIASAFVMKNPNQIPKMLRSDISCKNPVCLHYYTAENLFDIFNNMIDKIIEKYGKEKKIALLGRTQYDIKMILEKKKYHNNSIIHQDTKDDESEYTIVKNPFIEVKNQDNRTKIIYKKMNNLDIEFLTVHKAKGLEADNVIILNMKNSKLGFPNKIADDPVLQMLLPFSDNYVFAEERRLFYVAMTRTRNQTFILVPVNNASEFANEIKNLCHIEIPDGENLIINNPKCPVCKTGRLILRQKFESGNYFVGCSHYPHCSFTNNDISIIEKPIICPNCGGFLIVKTQKTNNKNFLGCSNYKDGCSHTSELKIENLDSPKTAHKPFSYHYWQELKK